MGFYSSEVPIHTEYIIEEAKQTAWVDSVMTTMTLDQKIAQFFMLGAYPTQGESNRAAVEKIIQDYQIGGVIFFKGNPNQFASWSNDFQAAANVPMFISVDGEWGVNMRVDSTIQYPRQLTLGAIQDNDLIFDMGEQIARECKALGININLAPVMDVNNNINNPVINDRSFGEDKYNVALKGSSYALGMQHQGVMAVSKHFPGHGDTDTDSHKDLPIIKHSFERLDSLELYPFKIAIEQGIMGMMAAHLSIPALDDTPNQASSLSKKVVTDLLKDSLGFKGLVFSDALNMQGVSKYYQPGDVDKSAFLAGNDVLVVSEDIPKGIALIKAAVDSGEISEAYIDQRLRKVLQYKYLLGLHTYQAVSTDNLEEKLQSKKGNAINRKLFESALTLAANENHLLPLKKGHQSSTASLAIGTSEKQVFQSKLEEFGVTKHFQATNDMASSASAGILDKLKVYDRVIVSVHNMSRWKSKNYGFSYGELDLLKKLNEQTEVVLVLFGTPYSLIHFDAFDHILVAYEWNKYTEEGAARALFGDLSINGHLPVSAGTFQVNTGYPITKNNGVLEYDSPENTGMDMKVLDSIELYAQKAIRLKATPGCQVLVAKNGKIIYEKSFGHLTYDKKIPVQDNTIYDVASITKVAATTLSIMKLYENGDLDLEGRLRHYLPQLGGTKVGQLVIKDILAHQAGLPAWVPFYRHTVEDSVYNNWYSVDSNAAYCVKVADDLFICKDSTAYIWRTIEGLSIKENPEYRYSDIGFYLLMKVIEEKTKTSLDKYVHDTFYAPMGLENIGFNPSTKFSKDRIPPTENDTIFRKQEVQGYVHDPGAAMLGGVCGHAGLFSNVHDLAAIFQMLLNGGSYNGQQFLKEETIAYFNTAHYADQDNRRGLGFDKPVWIDDKTGKRDGGPTSGMVSDQCFGHTGFTGTSVWADPENQLIYVFLSNRTYPDAYGSNILAKQNIRTDIQTLAYRAVKKGS